MIVGTKLACPVNRPVTPTGLGPEVRCEGMPVKIIEPSSKEEISEKKVLVVDDEDNFRVILRSFVESLGYWCAEAGSGREALGLLRKTHFPIVISDIVMPEMDGLELLRAIKSRHSDVDVLIVSAYGDNYSPMKIVESGASDFLPKPFNLEQLAARLYKIEMERVLRKKLYIKGITDDLTNLYNRGSFYQKLRTETKRAKRQGHPLSIIMLDVDGFKKFNDQYGHLKGDALLKMVARVLQLSVREHVDCIFRYGGDEFAVILPEADERAALVVGERIKKNFKDRAPAGLTLSIGAAEFQEDFDGETFVNLADKRMYEEKAKSKGLEPRQLYIGIEKDNHFIRCLNCGSFVHWTSSLCEKCLADPLKKTDSQKSEEIARTFLREVNESVEDRRRAPRIRIRKPITYDTLEAMICNISRGGVQIKAKESQSVGKKIRIALPLEEGSLMLGGIVVYAHPSAGGESLAGVQFSEISDEDSRLLKRFLDACSRDNS